MLSEAHTRVLWLLAGLAAVSAGCTPADGIDLPVVKSPYHCEETWPPSPAARNIPADWDAAVGRIVGCMGSDEVQVILQASEAAYGEWAYARLGLAIRNEWLRPDGSPLAANLRALGLEYPDDMSAALVSAVWHWIHGRRMDVRARVGCIKAWNWEMQRLARSTPFGVRIPDPDFRCDDDQTVQEMKTRWEAIGP